MDIAACDFPGGGEGGSMTRKYHNHTLKTKPWHCEDGTQTTTATWHQEGN